MGNRLDQLVLWLTLMILFFLSALQALNAVFASMLLSALFGAALRRLIQRIPSAARAQKRLRIRSANAYLDALLLRQADEKPLLSVLPEGVQVLYHLPDHALSKEDVLSLWRAKTASEDALTIATTGTVPRLTADFAQCLSHPSVALLARKELVRRLASEKALDLSLRQSVPIKGSFKARISKMLLNNRLGAASSCLYSAVFLALYLLTGLPVYLACSMLLLVLGGLSWHMRRSA